MLDKIKNFKGRVIFTRDTHEENYMDTQEGRNLPVPHCIKDTDGWMLNERVQVALDAKTYRAIHKPTFGSTELVDIFKGCNEKETDVTLIGVCTDICVVSNALLLKANYPEMNLTVDAKCCAGVTVESHSAALLTMKMCQINIEE